MSAGDATNGGAPADVLVVFGITGDLAKVMTFRSLYRLEQRGLLHCPIVGVAVDDWSVGDLRERARSSIAAGEAIDEDVFGRLAQRFSYVVDTSFFPSIGAVNPALTAMANAVRVGDRILERLGAPAARPEPTHVG